MPAAARRPDSRTTPPAAPHPATGNESEVQRPAPPAGEEIHLPGPTILPLVTAIAITLIVVGTTLGWIFSIIGGVVFVVAVIKWIADTRRDVAALPEDHH